MSRGLMICRTTAAAASAAANTTAADRRVASDRASLVVIERVIQSEYLQLPAHKHRYSAAPADTAVGGTGAG